MDNLLQRLNSGAPLALPNVADRVSDLWWHLGPRVRTAIAAALLLALLGFMGRGALRTAYGPPVAVVVAAHDLVPGEALTSSSVTTVEWPQELVPDDQLTHAEGFVRSFIPAGQPVQNGHVAQDLSSLLSAGTVAVAVPTDGLPDVLPGAHVDVILATHDGRGERAATDVEVVRSDGTWMWLAVPEASAATVAGAASVGRLALALRPPSQR